MLAIAYLLAAYFRIFTAINDGPVRFLLLIFHEPRIEKALSLSRHFISKSKGKIIWIHVRILNIRTLLSDKIWCGKLILSEVVLMFIEKQTKP